MREYETFLNKSLSKRQLPTRLVFLPMPLEDLIPALVEGKGDIAAAGLTVTAERRKQVAFTQPFICAIIVCRRPRSAPIPASPAIWSRPG